MRDFEDSTLWRISEFERIRSLTGQSGYAHLARDTVLSQTLQAELRSLNRGTDNLDVVELFAACVRHREPALIYLRCDGLVWPVTLFPSDGLYHSPRNIVAADDRSLLAIQSGPVEPPGVRPPGHTMNERIAKKDCYHPLAPALWALALRGPSCSIVSEIGGPAAYRILRLPSSDGLPTPGALGPATRLLHRDTVALRHIAAWPGMSVERATRLLNGLYLTSNLMVTRTHPKARPQPSWRTGNHGTE
jgi:hypothetical protein